jgi:oligopeptide/dipeptide ABC transporter ATP-binding protein
VAHTVAIMYAGCLVELAPTATLFASPAHPYTQALLAQVPRADRRTDATGSLEGWMPLLDGAPTACPFRERCPRRVAACDAAMPSPREVGPGHRVACHLYGP